MSCSPLFQPIRFLAACTLDRFCFSITIFDVCRGNGVLLRFHGFPLCVLVSMVRYFIKYLYVRAWGWVVDTKKGTLFTENPFKLLTI